MSKKKKIAIVSIFAMTAMILTGCGKSSEVQQDADAKYYTVSIDGERIAVDENDERILKLTEACEGYLTASVNRDYRNPDVTSEYEYFNDAMKESYLSLNYPETTLNMMNTNELVMELDSIQVNSIQLYQAYGEETAALSCEYISTITNSVQSYVDNLGIKQNTKYRRTMALYFTLENGEWKISDSSVSVREEVQ